MSGSDITYYMPAGGSVEPAYVFPEEGARIWLDGKTVGTVGKVQKLDDNNVRISLHLDGYKLGVVE